MGLPAPTETLASIEYKVTFLLSEQDRFVVPGRKARTFVKISCVTVVFPTFDALPHVAAMGIKATRSGVYPRQWGQILLSADLDKDNADEWIERARIELAARGHLTA